MYHCEWCYAWYQKATYYSNFLSCRHSLHLRCGTTSEDLVLAKAMRGNHNYLLFKREDRPCIPTFAGITGHEIDP